MAIKIAGVDVINDDRELVLAKLTDIHKTENITAVDVFVYDTSKDSDGGAWRHRTQHTSWYNEGASSTRGSRKEFPAVAVIVAESNKVTIYDGDDPSLPMWMVFIQGGSYPLAYILGRSVPNITAVSCLNGALSVSFDTVGYGEALSVTNFLSDSAVMHSSSSSWRHGQNIEGRNTPTTLTIDASVGDITNNAVNDVAMTVLPDAPTDPATGLPVPTIAVATDGGVSVIKDDGTVVDITQSGYVSDHVAFTEDNRVLVHHNVASGDGVYRVPIPTSDVTSSTAQDGVAIQDAGFSSAHQIRDISNPSGIAANGNGLFFGEAGGLHTFNEYASPKSGGGEDDANALHAITTSSYATGWMNGDIKMAALADTTAETLGDAASGATVSDPNGDGVYDGEHVTNGDFATNDDTGWTRTIDFGWNFSGGSAAHTGATGGRIRQAITTVVGKRYVLQFDLDTTGDLTLANTSVSIRNSADNNSIAVLLSGDLTANAAKSYVLYFTADETTHYVAFYSEDGATLDNVSVRLADPDRSVNGNGLGVHGSITKAPVATGADLVGYSGFNSSNYLEQPYNPDLNFGTGDFCVMGWFKVANYSATNYVLFSKSSDHAAPNAANGLLLYVIQDDVKSYVNGSFNQWTATPIVSGTWQHVCYLRRSGSTYLYIDGAEISGTGTQSGSVTDAAATIRIGNTWQSTAENQALIRISATAPTADQIKKIYEDEKVLFQENAKATLYYDGTSSDPDAVTALAHDPVTDLLHVGTSSGRSVFQGLRRVEESTGTDSQSLAAISAVDGLVVEGK